MTPASPSAGKRPSNPRHRAREFVIQGLYQNLVGGQDEAAILSQSEDVTGFKKADVALYRTLLTETLGDSGALRELLAPFIDRKWDEISPIERGILLVGACELKHHPETPYRVILNEAIELAKTYGGTDGHKFVNGILDKLAPVLRPDEAGRR